MWLKKKSSSVQSLHTWSKLAGFLESSEPYMHRKIQSLREQTWPWTAHVILKGFVKCNFLYYRTSKAFCSLQEIKYFEGKKDNSGNIFAFLGKKWKDEDVLTTKAPTLDMTDVNVDGAQDVLRHIRRRRKDIYQKPSGWQSGTLKDLTTSLVNGNQPWPSTWTHGCLGCSNLKKLESNAFPGRLPTALPAPRGGTGPLFLFAPPPSALLALTRGIEVSMSKQKTLLGVTMEAVPPNGLNCWRLCIDSVGWWSLLQRTTFFMKIP